MSGLKNFFYAFQSHCVRLVAFIAGLLPVEAAEWIARRIGDAAFFLAPKRRRTALENIERAYGASLSAEEKKEIARSSFEHMAVSLLELYTFPRIRRRAARRVTFTGIHHLDRAFSQGKGVIFVISHIGSWELLAFVPYLLRFRSSVVVKTIRNPYLDKRTNDLRRMFYLNPIPKKNASRSILKELKENNLVAILIDQWAGREGIWIDFFGEPTSTTSIPARISAKTGSPLIPARCIRTSPGRYRIEIDPPLFVDDREKDWEVRTTRKLNRQLEEAILKYRDQWTWGHRRWKPRPDSLRVPGQAKD